MTSIIFMRSSKRELLAQRKSKQSITGLDSYIPNIIDSETPNTAATFSDHATSLRLEKALPPLLKRLRCRHEAILLK